MISGQKHHDREILFLSIGVVDQHNIVRLHCSPHQGAQGEIDKEHNVTD